MINDNEFNMFIIFTKSVGKDGEFKSFIKLVNDLIPQIKILFSNGNKPYINSNKFDVYKDIRIICN